MSVGVRRETAPLRRWALNDCQGFEFYLVADCDDPFNFSARLFDPLDRLAGQLAWHRSLGNEVQLDELRLEPEPLGAGFKEELRWVLRGNARITTYRGRGLEGLLLQIALATAGEACAQRIYSDLSEEDVRTNPGLVKWLWDRGFVIADPPPAAPKGTVHRAYLDLPRSASA